MAVYDPAAFRDVFEHHFTYMAGFWRNVHRYASRPALHDPQHGRRWTYAELGADVERVAAGLAAHGVGPGDVVVFQLFNSPEWALLYLAAQHLGAIGSPINFRFSAGETAFVLDDSKPVVYVYDASLAEVAATALDLATHQPDATFVVDGEAGGTAPFGTLLTGEHPAVTPPADDRRGGVSTYDETTRLYTSGTTGMPKGVVAEQPGRGADRARRDHALPAVAGGQDAEHDAVVPPRRRIVRRPEPGVLRRRRGGGAARGSTRPWCSTRWPTTA